MILVFWGLVALLILTALTFMFIPVVQYARVISINAHHKYVMFIGCGLFVVLALLMYYFLGNYQGFQNNLHAAERKIQIEKAMAQFKSPEQVIEQLQLRLQQEPESAQGWYLLGRLYFSMQQFSKAADAFTKANQFKPNDPQTLLQLAQSLFFVNNKSFSGKPSALIQQVLQQDPQNMEALSLWAMASYFQHNYREAIDTWETLLNLVPPGSEDSTAILRAIHQAQQALANTSPETKQTTSNKGVKLNISLNPAVKNNVKPTDVVFIYAKSVDGNAMPLAVVKKQVRDLPFNFMLDDSMAMTPAAKISQHQLICIIVRVSKTGQALPQPGDWQGDSGVIEWQKLQKVVSIVISKKI